MARTQLHIKWPRSKLIITENKMQYCSHWTRHGHCSHDTVAGIVMCTEDCEYEHSIMGKEDTFVNGSWGRGVIFSSDVTIASCLYAGK